MQVKQLKFQFAISLSEFYFKSTKKKNKRERKKKIKSLCCLIGNLLGKLELRIRIKSKTKAE